MKKHLHLKKTILVLALALLSMAGWSQILYENFNYPVASFLGGNGNAGITTNNWTTHSPASGITTTINIETGNLNYTGIAPSVGNKAFMFGLNNTMSRDINRAFTSTANVLYFSALISIVDSNQVRTAGDYFMHFGGASGATVTSHGARLGAKIANNGNNFRFMICNISGGTPTFTDNGTDLVFGTTYLVVVKYDKSVTPTLASMWVNPTSLGGTEPTGAVTNNSGTGAFATFASICLRNNGTTPKVYTDEIRVGATWAEVTPTSVSVGLGDKASAKSSIYPNPSNGWFKASLPENGNYTISINNAIGLKVKSVETTKSVKIETAGLKPGMYFVTIQNRLNNSKEVHKLIVR